MIEKILLQNVSSYSPESAVSIAPLQRVNLFYGQNGTGKTTIGNFLQAPEKPCYGACSVEPANGEREILVYNQLFVEKNFHEAASQPGVFTLNEGNIEAEATLSAAESSIVELTVALDAVLEKKINCKSTQDEAHEKLLNSVWEPKRDFDKTALSYCFKSLNSRERLLAHVRNVPFVEITDTPQSLLSEAAELNDASDHELPAIAPITFQAGELETDLIMQEVITGSGDSYLSALIQHLGNSDWVKKALHYEIEANDQCPLCQQPLPQDFYAELRKVFDKTYEQRLGKLRQLENSYRCAIEHFLRQCAASEYQVQAIKLHIAELQSVFQKNLQAVAKKIDTPSLPVTLESTEALIIALNAEVATEQLKIDAFNEKIKNRKKYEEDIKRRFWNWYRASCNAALLEFEEVSEKLRSQYHLADDEVLSLQNRIQDQRDIVAQSKAAITNIDQSIESINNWLRVLGLKGFELIKEEGAVPQYRLERPSQCEGVFKTLSEGEKTLISFLYFLEVCNGELDTAGGKLMQERIIVIDDPISSLSHNYVYDIASLIRSQVLTPKDRFKQVIILTHNLFFFHEMVRLMKDDNKQNSLAMFRVIKSKYSSIVAMKAGEVQNDYQAFWQTIKDALNGRTSPNVIPNMMRNILEYYFSFVHQSESLRKVLAELSEEKPEYRALYRYINRESHSDSINLTDFGEINPEIFVERFRDVFIKTGFETHFEKMMA